MSLEITDLPLCGLKLIKRNHSKDNRGFFSRFFCIAQLSDMGWEKPVAQVNHSFTSEAGTVRGLHYQMPPYSEVKIVTCMKGSIWDVVVDLRRESATFLNWHAQVLSFENRSAMLIPEGFAHGFQSLTDNVELLYLHSESYKPEFEAALNICDPKLRISWPQKVKNLSERDKKHPMINEEFNGISNAMPTL